ncbi:YktB family protein [Halalkalibacter hemicellulosilyticus]|uniref:YktB family protein n=1 Tax=Halalkalibacter hemicellulosilyticus TaxID=127886 RepID=UPI003F719721
MNMNGFTKKDFRVFQLEGLGERMTAIQNQIQPKFQDIGSQLTTDLSMMIGNEMYLHIAKHARRKVNPPNDTWLAIADNKRGYKKHPHFQLGLFDDHLFIWLAFIYELPAKSAIANRFLNELDLFSTLSNDIVVSLDHMKKDAKPLASFSEEELKQSLIRFRDVKKAEFLVGKHLTPNDEVVQDKEKLVEYTKHTYEELLPLYQLAMSANE